MYHGINRYLVTFFVAVSEMLLIFICIIIVIWVTFQSLIRGLSFTLLLANEINVNEVVIEWFLVKLFFKKIVN